jgi:hypothetical protein
VVQEKKEKGETFKGAVEVDTQVEGQAWALALGARGVALVVAVMACLAASTPPP